MSSVIRVRVKPRSSRSSIDGFRDGALHVRVTAPPAGGEANEALLRLLATELGIGVTRLAVVHGHSSRNKTVSVDGLTVDELRSILHRQDGRRQ
jgi:uncharacterized protein (TIGR00251 family)